MAIRGGGVIGAGAYKGGRLWYLARKLRRGIPAKSGVGRFCFCKVVGVDDKMKEKRRFVRKGVQALVPIRKTV